MKTKNMKVMIKKEELLLYSLLGKEENVWFFL